MAHRPQVRAQADATFLLWHLFFRRFRRHLFGFAHLPTVLSEQSVFGREAPEPGPEGVRWQRCMSDGQVGP